MTVGSYAVLEERISSLSSLSRLRERFNPINLQFTRQHVQRVGANMGKKLPTLFP